jgi:hypothetical protein
MPFARGKLELPVINFMRATPCDSCRRRSEGATD